MPNAQLISKPRNPYPYQDKAIEYIRTAEHPAVFMQMRLGKTFCVLRALRKTKGRKLVVCPKSVIGTWQDEFEAEGITNYAWFTSKEVKRVLRRHAGRVKIPKWIVMNYEAVTRLNDRELSRFNCVVIDESVRLKDPQTKTTKFFSEKFRMIKKRVCLSGEPAPNTPLEYFSQFKFLKNEWMGATNYWEFRARYFGCDAMGWTWWPRATTKDLLRLQLKKDAFVLTRKQAGVAAKKVYERRVVEMPASVRKEYTRMEKEFVANLPDGKELETKYVLPQLSYLQQLSSGSLKKQDYSSFKIDEVKYLLNTELKKEPVLIWVWFTHEIAKLERALSASNISCASIQGVTPMAERNKVQERFQNGSLQVLIMQIATGRYGLNLSRASTAIYFSNPLSLDMRKQSEARIEHNAKKDILLYIDIVSKDTVEEHILNALHKKEEQSMFFLGDIVDSLKEKYAKTNTLAHTE